MRSAADNLKGGRCLPVTGRYVVKRVVLAGFVVFACACAMAAEGAPAARPHLFNDTGRFRIHFASEDGEDVRDVFLQVYDRDTKRWVGDQAYVLRPVTAEGKRTGYAIFRVKHEGTYHLRSYAVSDSGAYETLSPDDPASACDLVAVYDKTTPHVELIEPIGGETFAPLAEVVVTWQAEDETPLAADSVIVETSANGGIDWEELASGLPTVGQHRFKLPEGPSAGYVVRVSAVDRAGNTGTETSGEFRLVVPPARETAVADTEPDVTPGAVDVTHVVVKTVKDDTPPKAAPRPAGAVRGDRKASTLAWRKGVVYLLRGDYDEAVEELEHAVDLDPSFVSARVDLSVAYANDGRFRKARRLLERSIELYPQELSFRYNLGRLYHRQEDWGNALRHLNAALSITPGHVESLWLVADVHVRREELESARHYWQEVIENAGPGSRWRRKAETYLTASQAGGR